MIKADIVSSTSVILGWLSSAGSLHRLIAECQGSVPCSARCWSSTLQFRPRKRKPGRRFFLDPSSSFLCHPDTHKGRSGLHKPLSFRSCPLKCHSTQPVDYTEEIEGKNLSCVNRVAAAVAAPISDLSPRRPSLCHNDAINKRVTPHVCLSVLSFSALNWLIKSTGMPLG
jgi:hypothetical protein